MLRRPDFSEITSALEFDNWYWLKEELIAICKSCKLPCNGSKFELRDRIIYALDNEGDRLQTQKNKKSSSFNWGKEPLSLETVITDSVTFGPNFRNFMRAQIGAAFRCSGDFMAWVREHVGYTLANAVEAWHLLETRKDDPAFRTEIADFNMYNQFTRDFMDDNPTGTLHQVRTLWNHKKYLPAPGGVVKYQKSDLSFL